MLARSGVGQLSKSEQCGAWAGADSGKSGMQRVPELVQPLASTVEAGSEMLRGSVPLGLRWAVQRAAALTDRLPER